MDLFSSAPAYEPLAAKMRPQSLAEYCGQAHLLGPAKPLRTALEQGSAHSMIFWGPRVSGKQHWPD